MTMKGSKEKLDVNVLLNKLVVPFRSSDFWLIRNGIVCLFLIFDRHISQEPCWVVCGVRCQIVFMIC